MNIDPQSRHPGHLDASALKGSEKDMLHGYIYDYLLKHHYVDSAKIFFKEAEVTSNGKTTSVSVSASPKGTSPSSSETSNNNNNTHSKEETTSINGAAANSHTPANGTNNVCPVSTSIVVKTKLLVFLFVSGANNHS